MTNNPQDTVNKTEETWKKQLSPEQYYVLREKGTEAPYSGKLLLHKEKGIYSCAGCGNELFTDQMKFDSHCGWPSFDKEISGGKITKHVDNSHGMQRTEILCARCGGHLGHLFNDGPTETGQRYCVNSLSLEFVREEDIKTSIAADYDTIVLGGGCFWCVEAIYREMEGVITVESGYSGGKTKFPTYKEVCSGISGHAEVVRIAFNPTITTLEAILKVFFAVHDPTTLNRQGGDAGTQYRSVIFYRNEHQQLTAQHIIQALNTEKAFANPIVTELAPLSVFYKAEDYHQDYFNLNKAQPYCQMVIQPKMEKFEKAFKHQMKKP